MPAHLGAKAHTGFPPWKGGLDDARESFRACSTVLRLCMSTYLAQDQANPGLPSLVAPPYRRSRQTLWQIDERDCSAQRNYP